MYPNHQTDININTRAFEIDYPARIQEVNGITLPALDGHRKLIFVQGGSHRVKSLLHPVYEAEIFHESLF